MRLILGGLLRGHNAPVDRGTCTRYAVGVKLSYWMPTQVLSWMARRADSVTDLVSSMYDLRQGVSCFSCEQYSSQRRHYPTYEVYRGSI